MIRPTALEDHSDAALSIEPHHEVHDSRTRIFEDATKRPVHLRVPFILLVFLGGTLGTAARHGLGFLLPVDASIPWPILTANLAGSFLLGMLLELLIRRGPDVGISRAARLFLGTGFLGGFTTYSALAADTAGLLDEGTIGLGLLYAAASVVLGVAAAGIGIAVGSIIQARPR